MSSLGKYNQREGR